jgi:osmotically inducible protein OsmC
MHVREHVPHRWKDVAVRRSRALLTFDCPVTAAAFSPTPRHTMKHKASAQWQGSLKEGSGILSTGSGALVDKPYSFKTRFEGEPGTNPEELIGAAHAGCFSMAFSMILGMAGFTPEKIATSATISLEPKDGGFAITASHLDVTATIPGIDDATFQDLAAKAKAGCPVSKVLNAEITMDARLG